MKKIEETLKFHLPENIAISIPKKFAEGFREQVINLIYQSPEDVINNFQNKNDALDDIMKSNYLSNWTTRYIKQMNESENKEQYVLFLANLIQDMDKEVFLSNLDQLNKLENLPLIQTVIKSKLINYFYS